jgi:hypothetical protein
VLYPNKPCPFGNKCWFSHDEFLIQKLSPCILIECNKYLQLSEIHWLYAAKNMAFKLRHYAKMLCDEEDEWETIA